MTFNTALRQANILIEGGDTVLAQMALWRALKLPHKDYQRALILSAISSLNEVANGQA